MTVIDEAEDFPDKFRGTGLKAQDAGFFYLHQ
jgi:hypothetical protein